MCLFKWDYILDYNKNDINGIKPSPRYEYTRCKIRLSMRNNQHLSKTWRWILEKGQQHWGWVEKKRCLQKNISIERESNLLDYLIDSSFQGVNRLFVSSFENSAQKIEQAWIFSSRSGDKRLQVYNWWTERFWWAS